jgi:hypothetical protein
MASLSDKSKAIIREYPIARGLSVFLEHYSEFVSKFPSRPSCNEIARSASTGSVKGISLWTRRVKDMLIALVGAHHLIRKLLSTLQGLDAAGELPPHRGSSRKTLDQDIAYLYIQPPSAEAITILLEHVITEPVDEVSLWSAVYSIFSPMTPPPRSKSISPNLLRAPFLHDLHSDWNGKFFEDPLIGLRRQMEDCISVLLPPYYAKTLVFVQSSGMGKSRLADTFGTTLPMINFILRKDNVGYPPTDDQIQDFMRRPMSTDLRDRILDSPSRKDSPDPAKHARANIVWNHSVMFGIFMASFKICE